MRIIQRFWELANPNKFVRLTNAVVPYLWAVSLALIAIGLIWGIYFTPPEAKQGSTSKIIYVHVPTVFAAINIWVVMLVASLIWFIRRHHISALLAKAAAPVGAAMGGIGLLSGMIWGEVTWGTGWAWDPRLTAFFILLLCYGGYMALWLALENHELAADVTAALCLFGGVFAFLSRYAFLFWRQGLHQDPSLSADTESNIHNVLYLPLLVCLAGFFLLSVTLILYRTRTEIWRRRSTVLLELGK